MRAGLRQRVEADGALARRAPARILNRGRKARLRPGPSPLRTVRAGLPHTALRSVVSPRRGLTGRHTGCGLENSPRAAKTALASFTLCWRAVNMRLVKTGGWTLPRRQGRAGWLSPAGHIGRLVVPRSVHRASTFLRPLAPRALPRFNATMGALTPDRLSAAGQVSLIHVHGLPDHSVSNHLARSRHRFNTLPLSVTGFLPPGRSRLRPSGAGSPDAPGRIEFVILRTGRSPPVASHPASRRRGYSRLQAGERIPGADSHRSDHAHSQAHRRMTASPSSRMDAS